MNLKTKILLINEDKKIEKKFFDALNGEVFKVDCLPNTREALAKINSILPDIIVIHFITLRKATLDFCREIKNHKKMEINSIHILGITSSFDSVSETKILNSGADDFLKASFALDDLKAKINVGKRITDKIKISEREYKKIFEEIDVLLIQDGGCAPGYNPVTAFLTNHLESYGRKVYCTKEGFKSLVNGSDKDIVRLIYDNKTFKSLEHIKNIFNVSLLSEARGAQFRSERFPEFKDLKIQEKAIEFILKKKVKAIVAIGGNGTFFGIRDLQKNLPSTIQLFFIPVTIDSDVYGTETIGEHTGVEIGAEKIRCYLADSRTHKRVYVIEMMGADGGFHALHSCIGARAHFAVLPGQRVDHETIVNSLNKKTSAVIVVAEGYLKKERKEKNITDNAAIYFYKKLQETKIPIKHKVVCEPFSRDVRGAAPNNLDITLAQRMAYSVARHLNEGNTRIMPAINSASESVIPFSEIITHNEINSSLLKIANRLTN